MNTKETGVRITIEDPNQPDILDLLRDGEAYGASLYPAESNHYLDLTALCAPEVRFLVARDIHGRALGTGALVVHGDWAEIKRMWVVPDVRGAGVGGATLSALENVARIEGVQTLRLETGVRNDEALILYEKAGFQQRGPFADYRPDPLSLFFEKSL